MDLITMLYLVDVMGSLAFSLFVFLMLGIIFTSLHGLSHYERNQEVSPFTKKASLVMVIAAIILVLIPSKKTAYAMIAVKAGEEISKNPNFERISGKALQLLDKKLDEALKEEEK